MKHIINALHILQVIVTADENKAVGVMIFMQNMPQKGPNFTEIFRNLPSFIYRKIGKMDLSIIIDKLSVNGISNQDSWASILKGSNVMMHLGFQTSHGHGWGVYGFVLAVW